MFITPVSDGRYSEMLRVLHVGVHELVDAKGGWRGSAISVAVYSQS